MFVVVVVVVVVVLCGKDISPSFTIYWIMSMVVTHIRWIKSYSLSDFILNLQVSHRKTLTVLSITGQYNPLYTLNNQLFVQVIWGNILLNSIILKTTKSKLLDHYQRCDHFSCFCLEEWNPTTAAAAMSKIVGLFTFWSFVLCCVHVFVHDFFWYVQLILFSYLINHFSWQKSPCCHWQVEHHSISTKQEFLSYSGIVTATGRRQHLSQKKHPKCFRCWASLGVGRVKAQNKGLKIRRLFHLGGALSLANLLKKLPCIFEDTNLFQ